MVIAATIGRHAAVMSSDFSGRTEKRLDTIIPNTPFFPALELGELQENYRIPSDYRANTIGSLTLRAMIDVNRYLQPKQCEWVRMGYSQLRDVPSDELGDVHELTELYKSAVFNRAKAYLLRNYPSMNRRDRGDYPARDGEETEQYYLDESERYIQMLLGNAPAVGLRAGVV